MSMSLDRGKGRVGQAGSPAHGSVQDQDKLEGMYSVLLNNEHEWPVVCLPLTHTHLDSRLCRLTVHAQTPTNMQPINILCYSHTYTFHKIIHFLLYCVALFHWIALFFFIIATMW